ncbi:hypothetical protein [Paramicrobacterium agarici]|uniref:hypothetical protein n=1 Tax=Paramicrobacterium agarici TaxID=630514 RepID=UPI001152AD4A|nr:hypothetical protein [Microbacterium agarici]TQO24258.1 hypothetical protein FB385_3138 [Microbacterium agarici]
MSTARKSARTAREAQARRDRRKAAVIASRRAGHAAKVNDLTEYRKQLGRVEAAFGVEEAA